jgi:hypothetical protein
VYNASRMRSSRGSASVKARATVAVTLKAQRIRRETRGWES